MGTPVGMLVWGADTDGAGPLEAEPERVLAFGAVIMVLGEAGGEDGEDGD